jgi:hypothetical protein
MTFLKYTFLFIAGVSLVARGDSLHVGDSVADESGRPCVHRFEMQAYFDGKCGFLAPLNEVTPLLITRGLMCASLYEEIVSEYKKRSEGQAVNDGRNEIRRFHEDILSGTGDVGQLRWCLISGGVDSAPDGRRSPSALLELLSSAVCVSGFAHDSGRYLDWLREKGENASGCDVEEMKVSESRALRVAKRGFAPDVFVASADDATHFIAGSKAALEKRIAVQRRCGASGTNSVPSGAVCGFEVDNLGSLMVCAEKVYGGIVAKRVSEIFGDVDFRKFGAFKLKVVAKDSGDDPREESGIGIAELTTGSTDDADAVRSSLKFLVWKGIFACMVMCPVDMRAAAVLKILKDTEIESDGVKVRVELPITSSVVGMAADAVKNGWPGRSKL